MHLSHESPIGLQRKAKGPEIFLRRWNGDVICRDLSQAAIDWLLQESFVSVDRGSLQVSSGLAEIFMVCDPLFEWPKSVHEVCPRNHGQSQFSEPLFQARSIKLIFHISVDFHGFHAAPQHNKSSHFLANKLFFSLFPV